MPLEQNQKKSEKKPCGCGGEGLATRVDALALDVRLQTELLAGVSIFVILTVTLAALYVGRKA